MIKSPSKQKQNIIYDPETHFTYKKGNKLGGGGFGEVFEFIEVKTNKIFAGKIIPIKRIEKDPQSNAAFNNENKFNNNLNFEFLCKCHSSFKDNNNAYFILDYYPNKTLSELLISRKSLSEFEIKHYGYELLLAIEYLHSCNIIHRDLKLSNVLLSDKMEVRLGDFGLAIENGGDGQQAICGTPNYIAPEVFGRKSSFNYGFEIDIWSFGIILYTLFFHKTPFEDEAKGRTKYNILNIIYSFPSKIPISDEAKDLITKILVKDPKARPTIQQIKKSKFFDYGNDIPITLPSSTINTPMTDEEVFNYIQMAKENNECCNKFNPKSYNKNFNNESDDEENLNYSSDNLNFNQKLNENNVHTPNNRYKNNNDNNNKDNNTENENQNENNNEYNYDNNNEINNDDNNENNINNVNNNDNEMESSNIKIINNKSSNESSEQNSSDDNYSESSSSEPKRHKNKKRTSAFNTKRDSIANNNYDNENKKNEGESKKKEKQNFKKILRKEPTVKIGQKFSSRKFNKEVALKKIFKDKNFDNNIKIETQNNKMKTKNNTMAVNNKTLNLIINNNNQNNNNNIEDETAIFNNESDNSNISVISGNNNTKNYRINHKSYSVIDKYIYDEKYGVGYLLTNGDTGVIFNDNTKMILLKNTYNFFYINKKNDEKDFFSLQFNDNNIINDMNNKLFENKKKLLANFHKNLIKNLKDRENFNVNPLLELKRNVDCFVVKFLLTKYAIFFMLSNNLIQVKFNDKTEIAFILDEKVIYYVDKNKRKFKEKLDFNNKIKFNNEEMNKKTWYSRKIFEKDIINKNMN